MTNEIEYFDKQTTKGRIGKERYYRSTIKAMLIGVYIVVGAAILLASTILYAKFQAEHAKTKKEVLTAYREKVMTENNIPSYKITVTQL